MVAGAAYVEKLQDQVNTLQGQLDSVLANPTNQTAQVLQLTAQLTAINV